MALSRVLNPHASEDGGSNKRRGPQSEIVVHRVKIDELPEGADGARIIWVARLEELGRIMTSPDDFSERKIEQFMHDSLMIPRVETLDYSFVLNFLGTYMALQIMAINASGPPDAPWGGPITALRRYPSGLASSIWLQVVAMNRATDVKSVLDRVCSGSPDHPFYELGKNYHDNFKRMGTMPFIDTLGGIVDMVVTKPKTFGRDILIASRRGEFMGHVFVSYALQENDVGVRGLMPYGISRSPFYLPGTCMPPQDASGFIDALFGRIAEIAKEQQVTHIFTWPLEKMKERFVKMGYTVIPKNDSGHPMFQVLRAAVKSIYGEHGNLTTYIIDGYNSQFQYFDFVLKNVG